MMKVNYSKELQQKLGFKIKKATTKKQGRLKKH